ncbi:surface lipoprotein assembly modifier [Sinorhizobium meliloti]|uniref:surface lipoprotein assembly modifier n=1 Tax=Rhizobium meliloti TaxID=382 RepID=UPI002D787CA7|nr:surface lipoprotein assembly modifier [Sinorhizobium meliloti]WRQ67355.1 surface lipoprotein assembly modifier [Sinorhizobium meliloti]
MIRMTLLGGLLLAGVATNAAAATPAEIDASFKYALAEAGAGRLDSAIRTLRLLQAEVPAPRIRLELARLLLRTGDNAGALALFREVYLEKATPEKVRRNILPFIEEAELRVLRIRYGARIITDSNPSKVGEGGTVYFNGVPLEYQPPARKELAYGIEPWFSAEKLWQNGYLTKLHLSSRLFEDDDLRAGRVQLAVAKQVAAWPGLFIQANVDTGIARQNSYALPTIESWKRFRLSDTAGAGLGGQAGYMFSQEADVSGPFYRAYVFGDWTFRSNATVFATLSAETLDSRNDYYSYVATKLDFGVRFSVADVQLTPQISWKQTHLTEYSAFWGKRRRDATIRPEIALSTERLEWNGIRPEVSVFYEKRSSNVGIYEYDQFGGYVNLRKLF